MFDFDQTKNTKNTNKEKSSSNTKNNNSDNTTANHNIRTQHINTSNGSNGDTLGMGHKNGHENGLGYCNDIQTPPSKSKINLNSKKRSNFIKSSKASSKICPGSALFESSNNNNSASSTTSTSTTGNNHYNHHHSSNRNLNLNRGKRNQQRRPHNTNNTTHTRDPLDAAIDEQGGYNASGNHGGNYRNRGKHSGNYNARSRFSSPMGSYDEKRKGGNNNNSSNNNGSSHSYNSNIPRLKPASTMSHRKRRLGLTMSTKNNRRRSTGAISTSTHASTSTNTGTNTGTNKVTSSSGKLQAAAEEFRDDTTSSFSLNEERFKIPNVSHGHNVSRGHNVSQSVSQSKAHFISQSQPKEKEKTMKKQIEVVLIDDTDTENELDHDINKNGNKNGNDNNSDIDDSNEKKMNNHENAITAKVNDDMNTNTNTNTNMSANTHDITITSRNNSGKTDIDKDIDIDTDIDMSIHHPSKKQKKTDYSKTTTEEVLLQLSSSSSFLSSPQTSTSPPSSLLLHKSSSKSSFMMGNCVQLKQNEHGNEHEHGHGQRQRHDSEHSHDNEHRHRRGKGTFTPQQGHDDIILSSSSSSSSSSSLHTQPGELVKTKDTNDNTDDNTNTNIKSLSSIESANNQSNQDPIEITSPGDNDNDDKQVDDDDDDEVCEIHQFSPHKKHNKNTTERTNEIFTDDDDDFSFFNTMNEINSTPYKKLEDDSSFSSSNNNNNDSSSNITKRITRSPYGSKSRIRKAESKDFEKYNSTLNKSISTSTSTHLSAKEERTPIHELGPLPPQPPPSSSMTSSSPSRKLQAIGKSFMENISPTKLLNHCKRKGLNLTKMNNVIDDDIESVSSSAQSNPRGNTSNQRRKFTYGDKLDLMLQPSCPLKKNKKAKSSSSYEKVDESFRGKLGSVIGKTRRSSRLRNVKKQKNDEVIEIDDDDDDYDCSDGSDNESVFNEWGLNDDEQQIELAKKDSLRIQEEQKKKFGARHSVKVKRISIGKIVYSHSCSLAFQPGGAQQHIRLQYAKVQKGQKNDNKEEKEHVITVDDSINTMKYFTTPTMDEKREEDEDKASSSNEDEKKEAMEISSTSSVQKKHLADGLCHMNILVLRVEPNKKNDLLSLSNSYQPEFGKLIDVILKQKDRERRFILIEFNKNTDLQKLLQLMKGNGLLSALLDTGSISSSEMHKYIESFKKEDDKLKKERIRSNTFRPDEVVLTFPFDATYAELNEAAQDLSEVNGLFNNEETATKNEEDKKQGTYVTTSESEKFRNVWKHSHTVRGEDFDRLEPGEYLNDTLIDLWMTWILRREDASSNVHFFSTQFFQKIQDQGPQSVVSWTKRRKINIFEKKFIFIPINDYLHWSICVVVNPGKIENAYGDDEVRSGETDAPFLLFLDSLRAHQKNKVKGHIYSWLNLEATRLNLYQNLRTRKNESLPFWPHSMPMFDPVVPYQDNGWDCGVFVCRYALGVLSLRNKRFTFDSSKSYATLKKDMQKMLRNLITEDDGFKFNMDDIARLRDEFAQLIKNLSHMYKQKEIEKKRLKRMKEKEEQCGEQTSNKGGMFV